MHLEGRAAVFIGVFISSFDIDFELAGQQLEDSFSAECVTTEREFI